MTAKIIKIFKVVPKSIKIGEEVPKFPEIRECQVILKDINHQFSNNELKLFNEILINENCKSEKQICKICKKEFSWKTSLNVHMKAAHPEECKLLYCVICNQRFLRKCKMDDHIRNKHPDGQKQNQQFECDFDGRVFKTKGNLYTHMQQHLPMVECLICHKMLKRNVLKAHLRDFHATKRKFQCKICPSQLNSRDNLAKHEKNHNKKFECNICKRMYSTKTKLNRHKRNNHENPGSFECETCGKKFNLKENLKNHQLTHKKDRLKSLKCPRCDYQTDMKYRINRHQNFHERQDRKFALMKNPIKCEKCPYYYCKNQTALKIHMRRVHSKKLFQCDLCAKFFKRKEHLTTHIKLHIRKIKKK
jgi:KRAB domain-containing zinc finger protein